MAAEDPSDLIRAVRAAAASLQLASRWERGAVFDAAEDFVFEMYVLTRLLLAARPAYRVRYVAGKGQTAHAFPRKPAAKKGRPRFRIVHRSHAQHEFQVCAGTKIRDMHGTPRTPDISIQAASASDDPAYSDVVMMWDAKFRSDHNDRITGDEFSTFARWIDLFQLRGAPIPVLELGTLAPLAGNTLVCNGFASTEPNAELRRVSVREATSFWPGRRHEVRPPDPAGAIAPPGPGVTRVVEI